MNELFTDFSKDVGKLMVAFFIGTITSAEHDRLDEWVESSDDNLTTFEEFVEIAYRTHSY
jgi:hypothetical protein